MRSRPLQTPARTATEKLPFANNSPAMKLSDGHGKKVSGLSRLNPLTFFPCPSDSFIAGLLFANGSFSVAVLAGVCSGRERIVVLLCDAGADGSCAGKRAGVAGGSPGDD